MGVFDAYLTLSSVVSLVTRLWHRHADDPAVMGMLQLRGLPLLLAGLRFYTHNEHLECALIQLLVKVLNAGRVTLRSTVAEYGPCIVAAMKKFPANLLLCSLGGQVLAKVCGSCSLAQEKVVEHSGVEVLVDLLAVHTDNVDVLIALMGALSALGYSGNCHGVDSSAGSMRLSRSGAIELVVKHMQQYHDIPPLLTAGMGLLCTLSALNNGARKQICDHHGVEQILKALMDFPRHLRPLQQGVSALIQIVARTQLRATVVALGARPVLRAIAQANTGAPGSANRNLLVSKCRACLETLAGYPEQGAGHWWAHRHLIVQCICYVDSEPPLCRLLWLPCDTAWEHVLSIAERALGLDNFVAYYSPDVEWPTLSHALSPRAQNAAPSEDSTSTPGTSYEALASYAIEEALEPEDSPEHPSAMRQPASAPISLGQQGLLRLQSDDALQSFIRLYEHSARVPTLMLQSLG